MTEPTYRFVAAPGSGLFYHDEDKTVNLAMFGKDYGEVVGDKFIVAVRRSTNYTLPTSTWYTISWESALTGMNDVGMWDSGDPTKLGVAVAGLYHIVLTVRFEGPAANTSRYVSEIMKNGSGDATRFDGYGHSTVDPAYSCSTVWWLVPGDYIQAQVWQNSGSNKSLYAAYTRMEAKRIG